jgi:hypothetical protein
MASVFLLSTTIPASDDKVAEKSESFSKIDRGSLSSCAQHIPMIGTS